MENNYYAYDSPFGKMMICSDGKAITHIVPGDRMIPAGCNKANALTDKAAKQLEEYFAGERREFDLPLDPQGTQFQRSVWNALLKIPYGETKSYMQIAKMVDNPKACRAVGMANNKNPIWIVIPCHRVIGADGSLTGYGGGLEMKQRLLELEKADIAFGK